MRGTATADLDLGRVWGRVARVVADHIAAGRGHLLTEDVVRFATIIELQKEGVPPANMRAEYQAPELTGGKLDLTVGTPPEVAVEFKFPRDPTSQGAPDTMTLGELLRDVYRLAAVPGISERWLVQAVGVRLRGYLSRVERRHPLLRWTFEPGEVLRLSPDAVGKLPRTAAEAITSWSATHSVEAECIHAFDLGEDVHFFTYRLRDQSVAVPTEANADAVESPEGEQLLDASVVPEVLSADTRRGARREIHEAARAVLTRNGRDSFSVLDVTEEMHRRETGYADSTIRTMITGHLCADAPDNAATTYDDFERVDRGLYRFKWR